MLFEWDIAKNETNKQKHGVAFEKAKSVFDDPYHLIFPDRQHSTEENDSFALGLWAMVY